MGRRSLGYARSPQSPGRHGHRHGEFAKCRISTGEELAALVEKMIAAHERGDKVENKRLRIELINGWYRRSPCLKLCSVLSSAWEATGILKLLLCESRSGTPPASGACQQSRSPRWTLGTSKEERFRKFHGHDGMWGRRIREDVSVTGSGRRRRGRCRWRWACQSTWYGVGKPSHNQIGMP